MPCIDTGKIFNLNKKVGFGLLILQNELIKSLCHLLKQIFNRLYQ